MAADDAVKMEDIDEEPDADDENSNEKAISKRLRERSATTSKTLMKLGVEVCMKCGWQPLTARSDPSKRFGKELRPLNWVFPIDTTMKRPEETADTESQTIA
jgi:hypothetical protein